MGGITTEEALCLVLQHTPVIQEKEQIQIANISGRVLAEDVKTVLIIRPFTDLLLTAMPAGQRI